MSRRVCVVGCGAAGLCSAKRALAEGMDVVLYERSPQLGGTWVYTDAVGNDAYGLPIHTSMYKGLRTNLPKEIMGFPDYPIPEQDKSYLPAEDILAFLNNYAEHFKLFPHIKFNHYVKLVRPEGEGWLVTVVDLPNNKEIEEKFDAIMVCNGHYHTPLVPKMEGDETFPGVRMHSHDYRDSTPFKGQTVVVVGAGPSGIDLSLDISYTARKVILSHHQEVNLNNIFPENVEHKLDITKMCGSTVIFQDGSSIEADVIFYCTGYKYCFPFLSPDCGVTVEDNCVEPLYKHMINIDRPTMCLIGLPYYVCAFSLFDLQARVFLGVLSGGIRLPSKEAMYKDFRTEVSIRRKLGLKHKQFHMMGPLQGQYYDELAELGRLEPLPPVMTKLHNDASQRQLDDNLSFRNDVYKIIDENNYIKVN